MTKVNYLRSAACALVISSLAGCGLVDKLRSNVDPMPPQQAKIKCFTNLVYVPGGGAAQSLDIYVPAGRQHDRPWPVIVWIHGGAWVQGDKEQCPLTGLTDLGYAIVSLNYRLADAAAYPAQIDDVRAALKFLRANARRYDLDADHVGLCGFSAGGHLAALAGTSAGKPGTSDPSRVQAVCAWSGVSNLLSAESQRGAKGKLPFEGAGSVVYRLFAGRDSKANRKSASPVFYVTPDDPPFFIVHGEEDYTVPVAQSEELARTLKKAGVDVQLHRVAGCGHEFGTPQEAKAMVSFFGQHLQVKGPAKAARPCSEN